MGQMREAFITTVEWYPVWVYYDPTTFQTEREDRFYPVPCELLDEYDAAYQRFREAQNALRDFFNERESAKSEDGPEAPAPSAE